MEKPTLPGSLEPTFEKGRSWQMNSSNSIWLIRSSGQAFASANNFICFMIVCSSGPSGRDMQADFLKTKLYIWNNGRVPSLPIGKNSDAQDKPSRKGAEKIGRA